MASVETHTQFTGSHNDPEAQGTWGGEHLYRHTHIINDSEMVCKHTNADVTASVSHSQVICRGSSYDGVERPLGEAFARSVVDEDQRGDGAIHLGRGQLHQLAGGEMKVKGVCEQNCLRNLFSPHLFFFFCCYITILLVMTKCRS